MGRRVLFQSILSFWSFRLSADSLLKSVLQHLLQVELTSPKVEPTDGFLSRQGKKPEKVPG
jgi:hypothetical protein